MKLKYTKLKYTFLTGALTFFSTMVFAGFNSPFPVEVTLNPDGSGRADGDMVSARFADNDFELIGCGVRIIDDGAGGNFQFGFCQATDSAGEQAICNTFRADLLEAMRSTADYSFITFDFNSDGECTRIGFSTQSFYIPDNVDKAKKK